MNRGSGLTDRIIQITGVLLVLALVVFIVEPRLFYGFPYALRADEPVFSNLAAEIAAGRQWEPGWYGHPGTIPIYLQAFGFAVSMVLSGRGEALFSGEISYADAPADVILIGRLLMIAFGLGIMAYLYATCRLFAGRIIAFACVLLLFSLSIYAEALVRYRTDIPQTFFVLMGFYHALRDEEAGWSRHRVLAAMSVGLAVLCKWPGVLTCVFIIYASGHRLVSGVTGLWREARNLALSGLISIATAFVIAPRMFLDFGTLVLPQVARENKGHLSHTSEGFFWALSKYMQLFWSELGPVLCLLALVGLVSMIAFKSYRRYLVAALGFVLYVMFISALSKWWERWSIPIFPILMVLIGVGLASVAKFSEHLLSRKGVAPFKANAAGLVLITVIAGGVLIGNVLALATENARLKREPTRIAATQWVEANIPKGSRLLLEKYTVLPGPTDYEIWLTSRRARKTVHPKKMPDGLYFDSGLAALSPIGFDPDILDTLCEREISFVVANHSELARYETEGGFEDVVARFGEFLQLFPPVAEFSASDPNHAMRGPKLVIYDTRSACEIDRSVLADLPPIELHLEDVLNDDDDEDADD